MTEADRAAIRARCEAATQGPWTAEPMEPRSCLDKNGKFTLTGWIVFECECLGDYECHFMTKENADFVAHARTDLPALLDAMEAAEKRVRELEGALAVMIDVLGNYQDEDDAIDAACAVLHRQPAAPGEEG